MTGREIEYVESGPYIWATSIPLRGDDAAQRPRASRREKSCDSQEFANLRRSWRRLQQLLAANFPTEGSGIVGVATFDDRHLPRTREQTQARFAYFRNTKLKPARLAAGLSPPVVIWAPEVLTSVSGRWHVHFVTDAAGHDFDMLRRAWIYGGLELDTLKIDPDAPFEALAKYMAKELREAQEYKSRPGLHGWSCTRNAVRPKIERVRVPDDFPLACPEGCRLIAEEFRGDFGEIHSMCYQTAL